MLEIFYLQITVKISKMSTVLVRSDPMSLRKTHCGILKKYPMSGQFL